MAQHNDLASRVVLDAEDAHLMLEGMSTPIYTHITRRSARGMTVEQPLPFLQLRTMVQDQTERRARIESVSMLVCDGMPRLILDLAYEPDVVAEIDAGGAQANVGASEPVHADSAPARMVRPRVDETRSFEQRETIEQPVRTAAGIQAPETSLRSSPQSSDRESTQVFDTVPPPADEQRVAEDASIDDIVERMQADRLGPRLARGWAKVKPHVRHAAILVVAFLMRSARRAYPHARTAGERVLAIVGRGARSLRDRLDARAARAAQIKQD